MTFTFAPAADRFVRRLLRYDGGATSGLRLVVNAGGCSGLAAEFDVLPAPLAGDAVVRRDGLTLFLPASSRLLLDGVTIDFVETPTQSGFVLRDPKAKACGCGGADAPVALNNAVAELSP